MNSIKIEDVTKYVEQNIGSFHKARLDSLKTLKFDKILRRKNPYLFKAKNVLLAQDFVQILLDAYLSSQEETIFGVFLEGLARFINQKVYGGWKSTTQGLDLEFDKDGIRYIVAIKSGPNWGNSSQIRKMKEDFRKANQTIRSSNSGLHIVAVNGCCYGRNTKPDKGDYYKYCGQVFWEFISGNSDLYLKIIKPLGYSAKKRNDEFSRKYSQIVNNFTSEFSKKYVSNGEINWDALVQFNSSKPNRVMKKGKMGENYSKFVPSRHPILAQNRVFHHPDK
ncbi:MAG: PmeII family type II restriction endonuclease [Dehalococcoidales bacterium]|nr:PmeII family type II restriction endonuclease [Dehalococcoidales bacterium]